MAGVKPLKEERGSARMHDGMTNLTYEHGCFISTITERTGGLMCCWDIYTCYEVLKYWNIFINDNFYHFLTELNCKFSALIHIDLLIVLVV